MKEHHPLVQLARRAIEAYVREGRVVEPKEAVSGKATRRAGTFVSLHDSSGQLRGCIGTFLPTQPSVEQEVVHNAISAATRDPRFPPVRAKELAGLNVKVDVLSRPEPVDGPDQLDPKRYGLILQSAGGWHRRGLLLPDLPGVDTVAEQMRICRLKAGIGPDEPVEMERFEVERYT